MSSSGHDMSVDMVVATNKTMAQINARIPQIMMISGLPLSILCLCGLWDS